MTRSFAWLEYLAWPTQSGGAQLTAGSARSSVTDDHSLRQFMWAPSISCMANLVRRSAVAVDGSCRPVRPIAPIAYSRAGLAWLHQTAGRTNSKRANRSRPVQNLQSAAHAATAKHAKVQLIIAVDYRREADSVASRWMGSVQGSRFADGRDPIGARFRFIFVRFVNKISCHMYVFPFNLSTEPSTPTP